MSESTSHPIGLLGGNKVGGSGVISTYRQKRHVFGDPRVRYVSDVFARFNLRQSNEGDLVFQFHLQ